MDRDILNHLLLASGSTSIDLLLDFWSKSVVRSRAEVIKSEKDRSRVRHKRHADESVESDLKIFNLH